jgi:hypothetical protein
MGLLRVGQNHYTNKHTKATATAVNRQTRAIKAQTAQARRDAKARNAAIVTATAAPAPADLVEQLSTLAELHASGALTAAEFATAKAQLLGSDPPPIMPDVTLAEFIHSHSTSA